MLINLMNESYRWFRTVTIPKKNPQSSADIFLNHINLPFLWDVAEADLLGNAAFPVLFLSGSASLFSCLDCSMENLLKSRHRANLLANQLLKEILLWWKKVSEKCGYGLIGIINLFGKNLSSSTALIQCSHASPNSNKTSSMTALAWMNGCCMTH